MIDNRTFVYRTEATGGALVAVFHENHSGAMVFRVVCECCHDLHTGPGWDGATSRAGRHAGLCTKVPQRLRAAELLVGAA